MSSLARRESALDTKLASLGEEVAAWQKLAATAPFAIHRSQLTDTCGVLAAMHDQIDADIREARSGAALTYAEVESFERDILSAFRIWECYRSKFALRLVEWMSPTLGLLDDLAWEAYRPARELAVAAGTIEPVAAREPPLVFPNARWSPFARSREQAYELDEVTGDTVPAAGFDRWLERLPVPLVGIPWFQMGHYPDAVYIGHELGHIVEDDFGLGGELRAAIEAALVGSPNEQRTAWKDRWRSEVFGDVYGVLTTGSAYAAVLIDQLALDEPSVATAVQPDPARPGTQKWASYPTRALRARVVCETVRQLGTTEEDSRYFADRAEALESASGVLLDHKMAHYNDDIPLVVAALLKAPLNALKAKRLVDVLPFTKAMEESARQDAAAANQSGKLNGDDVRTLFAGAAHAFTSNPANYRGLNVQKRFHKRMLDIRTQAVRARGPSRPGAPPPSLPAPERNRVIARSVLGILRAPPETASADPGS